LAAQPLCLVAYVLSRGNRQGRLERSHEARLRRPIARTSSPECPLNVNSGPGCPSRVPGRFALVASHRTDIRSRLVSPAELAAEFHQLRELAPAFGVRTLRQSIERRRNRRWSAATPRHGTGGTAAQGSPQESLPITRASRPGCLYGYYAAVGVTSRPGTAISAHTRLPFVSVWTPQRHAKDATSSRPRPETARESGCPASSAATQESAS
jgi:hypothetical protein